MIPSGRQLFLQNTRKSAVQFNINSKEFSAIAIPLPPIDKQKVFVDKVKEIENLAHQSSVSGSPLGNPPSPNPASSRFLRRPLPRVAQGPHGRVASRNGTSGQGAGPEGRSRVGEVGEVGEVEWGGWDGWWMSVERISAG